MERDVLRQKMKAEYQKLAILLKQIHTADHAGVEEAAQHTDKKPDVFSSSASQESSLNSNRIELPQLPICKLQFLSLPLLSSDFT